MANRSQLFGDLLRYVEGGDANRPISIFIEGANWDFEAHDLKDILLTALFEVPSLKKSLDLAHKDVETLQEQIAGAGSETLSFEPPTWEYDYIPFNPIMNYIAAFNKRGSEGWELVHCDFRQGIALFKRPKNE